MTAKPAHSKGSQTTSKNTSEIYSYGTTKHEERPMTEATGFILMYYGTFAAAGALAGILVAAIVQVFGNW